MSKKTEPLELEVMPAHDIVLRKFIVTAYSKLPADRLTEEPDIRVEIDADSACAASVAMMRQLRRPSYFYVTVSDITPARKRRSHVESVECESEQLSEESEGE